ncbi:MAG: class I SAM-dependent methyltransferase [Pseudomonadota bacterium]
MSAGFDWALGRPEDLEIVSETDRHGRPLRTVIDMGTGLVRNDPIPGDDELARFYAEEYRTAYKGAARPRRRQIVRNFRRAAAHIAAFRDVIDPAMRVLDVGAGSGEFLYLVHTLGKSAHGIEPNRGYAEYCRDALGLDVASAHLAPDLFAPGAFDLIRLNHVLEHLNDPVGYLEMIAAWLAPDGLLQVEVPNIEVYCRAKSRGGMFHYGHIFNFNPWTLRAAAGLAGLAEAEETAPRSTDTTGAFFRIGQRWTAENARNPENAHQVRALIRHHYEGDRAAERRRRPLSKLAHRIEETATGLFAGTPRAIADRAAARL